jgi:hypothetical protein
MKVIEQIRTAYKSREKQFVADLPITENNSTIPFSCRSRSFGEQEYHDLSFSA